MSQPKTSKKLIVANWKMNPLSSNIAVKHFEEIRKTANKLRNVQTVVCPPSIFLESLAKKITGHRCVVGAQDVFYEKGTGSNVGEVSVEQLKKSKVEYVIIGHSERRSRGETDEIVNKKVTAALKGGLKVILCVGEKERDHDGGHLDFIARELVEDLKNIPRKYFLNLIVAYEPIWAISNKGNGPADPHDVYKMIIFVRKVLARVIGKDFAMSVPILYGGSSNPDTALNFLEEARADGLLVGKASLSTDHFSKMLKIADKSRNE